MQVTRIERDGEDIIIVREAYAGAVVMPAEKGEFSIQHRDGGIEISRDGVLHWSSTSGYFPGEGPA